MVFLNQEQRDGLAMKWRRFAVVQRGKQAEGRMDFDGYIWMGKAYEGLTRFGLEVLAQTCAPPWMVLVVLLLAAHPSSSDFFP